MINSSGCCSNQGGLHKHVLPVNCTQTWNYLIKRKFKCLKGNKGFIICRQLFSCSVLARCLAELRWFKNIFCCHFHYRCKLTAEISEQFLFWSCLTAPSSVNVKHELPKENQSKTKLKSNIKASTSQTHFPQVKGDVSSFKSNSKVTKIRPCRNVEWKCLGNMWGLFSVAAQAAQESAECIL